MLPSRQKRLNRLGDTEGSWNRVGALAPGERKIGEGQDFFVFLGRTRAILKTQGAALSLSKDKTILQPGTTFNIATEFARVSFAQHSFNPLADQASTAVLPIPTFVPTIPGLDPDLQVLGGIVSALEGLLQAMGG